MTPTKTVVERTASRIGPNTRVRHHLAQAIPGKDPERLLQTTSGTRSPATAPSKRKRIGRVERAPADHCCIVWRPQEVGEPRFPKRLPVSDPTNGTRDREDERLSDAPAPPLGDETRVRPANASRRSFEVEN